ncbi:MAG: signal peptide peptidase SppA [Gammaproteobacteria bacterium]|nr:signal peptide peptidase SppA [Gammaproteobacteria bacterium]
MARRNIVFRFFSSLWRFVDESRRLTVNLIFLLLVFALLSSVLTSDSPAFPESAALVVDIQGDLVDQLAGDPLDRAIAEATGDDRPQTVVRDVVDAIRGARDDDRIKLLVLELDGLRGASLPKMQAIATAIGEFRSAGKKVIANGSYYVQNQYYLASAADEVYMHPFGAVYIEGYGRYRMFFKDAIDKLKIDWNVFRVGEYKSFVEPYTRTSMSEEDRQSSLVWLNALWSEWQQDVTEARGLPDGAIADYVENIATNMSAQQGDSAKAALAAGLVDELLGHEVIRERLIGIVGEDKKNHSYKAVNFRKYVGHARQNLDKYKASDQLVAVVVAVGSITTGDQPPGTIGSESLSRQLIQARENDKVKAVVLQIDSGGGSMLASEIILREIELLKATGKPVIASMGGVAASGGYYIAMPADEIFANSGTITGSIGVLGMFPTFQRSLGALGLNVDGVGTTSLSGGARPDRELSTGTRDMIQQSVENSYRVFVGRVAASRNTTPDEIDKIARGRVWVGQDALNIGLVDKIGSLDDAIAAAAERAGLGESYSVQYIEKQLGFRERFLLSMLSFSGRIPHQQSPVQYLLNRLDNQFETLSTLNDPGHRYAICFCEVW